MGWSPSEYATAVAMAKQQAALAAHLSQQINALVEAPEPTYAPYANEQIVQAQRIGIIDSRRYANGEAQKKLNAQVEVEENADYAGFVLAYAFGYDDVVRHLGFRVPTLLDFVKMAQPSPRKKRGWDALSYVAQATTIVVFLATMLHLAMLYLAMLHLAMLHLAGVR